MRRAKRQFNGKDTGKKNEGQSWAWDTKWLDETSFEVYAESYGADDTAVSEWVAQIDEEIEEHFSAPYPELRASKVDLSRNDITDVGVATLMDFFRRRRVSVERLKFFRNSIGDAGAEAIGHYLAKSPSPTHELHLSHNFISEDGVSALIVAIAKGKRYPCQLGRAQEYAPLWLRLEQNCVKWDVVSQRLKQKKIQWTTALSRNLCHAQDSSVVCLHTSYHLVREDIPITAKHWAAQRDVETEVEVEDVSPAQASRAEPRKKDEREGKKSKASHADGEQRGEHGKTVSNIRNGSAEPHHKTPDVTDMLKAVAPHVILGSVASKPSQDAALKVIDALPTNDDEEVRGMWRMQILSSTDPHSTSSRIRHLCEVLRATGYLSPVDKEGPVHEAANLNAAEINSTFWSAEIEPTPMEAEPVEPLNESKLGPRWDEEQYEHLLGALMDPATALDAKAPNSQSPTASGAVEAIGRFLLEDGGRLNESDAAAGPPQPQKTKKGANKMR